MATVTHRVTTADTSTTPNTSGAFTPALNDLLVAFVTVSATIDTGPTLTSSVGGFTFSLQSTFEFQAGNSRLYLFISDALVSSAISQTVTANTPGDAGSGTVISVYSVSGMTKTGALAVRQTAGQNSIAAGTPAPAFASSCLTGNPTLGAIANQTNPAGVTEPTGWTEGADTGYITPTVGTETVFRDSGFTGTTITWGSASASDFGSSIVELDASAAGDPFFTQLGAAYC